MVKLTKEQRRALKRAFDCAPVLPRLTQEEVAAGITVVPLTYKQFRRMVVKPFGMDCIMIPWQGMFLGIERDGYTHT